MRFDILTLFPEICQAYLQESILKRARAAGRVDIQVHNFRDYTTDAHHVTDDLPYGGGGGMVLKPEPLFAAVESILEVGSETSEMGESASDFPPPTSHLPLPTSRLSPPTPIILLTPQGRPFTQAVAQALAQFPRLLLICGRYEGFDERVREHLATDEISIGDYVLTGGELGALVIVDAVTRLLPGVLGDPTGAEDDSFASGLLEYPHYTRPAEFRGWRVPEALVSGDHARIAQWRRREALRRTFLRRPDLLLRQALPEAERLWLAQVAETLVNPGR
ncbi:MAG: tRNA (guanosine(37)-N1)-methyltransferase TrmD [Anaerolineales bacterium]|nr:tRNA (guanosine(37)-N1)-methyltransferase TrmD [Anaerolineales bacterium]